MSTSLDFRARSRAAGLHLLVSAVVAGLAAFLVFALWYPGPYRLLAGGQHLFVLLTGVDVVIGPLLTFVVFNRAKGRRHLRRDLAVIVLLQLLALGYGLHTMYVARPVAMVFEVDRFRLITAKDVHLVELPKALPAYRDLPVTGPWLLGARVPAAGAEKNEALFMGVSGIDVAQRPTFWRDYEEAKPRAVARSRPIGDLLAHHSARASEARRQLAEMHAAEDTARFLPVVARTNAVAVLDSSGVVLGYLPLDGFF